MFKWPVNDARLGAPALDIAARVFFVTVDMIIHDFRDITNQADR